MMINGVVMNKIYDGRPAMNGAGLMMMRCAQEFTLELRLDIHWGWNTGNQTRFYL
jgi:hypothetical protein